MKTSKTLLLLLAAAGALRVDARPVLPQLFTDNMVLQQQSQVPIWGTARAGRTVTVVPSWSGEALSVKADADGRWSATMATPEAGGPHTVTISDGQRLTLHNVMVGEVWLCSGQSNMEMPVDGDWARVDNCEQEVEQANGHPGIRLLQMTRHVSTQPSDEVQTTRGGWKVCSAETVRMFSATAYFFGRDIHRTQNVAVGLIDASWGGTFIEPWISAGALATHPDMGEAVATVQGIPTDPVGQAAFYADGMARWQQQETALDPGYADGVALWADPDLDDSAWDEVTLPCEWTDMGLADFDGVVWYRHAIDIPADMAGRQLKLSLGQVDDIDYTYFNGQLVGQTYEFGQDRLYTVPAHLVRPGRNVITVRVIDNTGGGGIYSDASKLSLSSGSKTLSLAAVWRYRQTTAIGQMPSVPNLRPNQPNQVTVLYNAMINPLKRFPIRGAIWYQGCNNEHKGYQYRELLPLLIADWREQWGYDFPFYIVQLANYRALQEQPGDDEWAELREAQAMSARHVAGSGLACTIDIGDAEDIHPRNKQEVGRRLGLVARAKTYGERGLEYSGPVYVGHQIEGRRVRIEFSHARGLHFADDQPLQGFAVAGADRQWHWAEARIEGQTVVVSCPDVSHPVAVRYGWAVNPVTGLRNGDGLPAVPFRTDDWPGLSATVHRVL